MKRAHVIVTAGFLCTFFFATALAAEDPLPTRSERLPVNVAQIDFTAEATKASRILGCTPQEVKPSGASNNNILFDVNCAGGTTLLLTCDATGLCLKRSAASEADTAGRPGSLQQRSTASVPVEVVAQPAGKARIVITSEPLMGNTADVEINGRRVASVNQDQSYNGLHESGKLIISTKHSKVEINAEPNKEYVLLVAAKVGSSLFGPFLAATTAEYTITLKETRDMR